ncbi:MAG TPA: transketolase C-terminal domain-containing protein [Streptosporangiaceae bacterium]|nr:transketolase C-terminal domain-containing protein [Streptosporangiaceae bacterium]
MTDQALSTRLAYREALLGAMAEQPRVVCLDADTGLFADADFGQAAGRYVNVGIAEQHAMTMAAALALDGWMPFVTTFAAFAETRAAEAVKIDVAYNAVPVRIAVTHGGLSAEQLGPTHHALADLALMRALPHMTVVVPADAGAVRSFVQQSLTWPGPLYLRLGRKPTEPVPAEDPPVIGQIQVLRARGDVVIAACGPHPVAAALAAAAELAVGGISAAVLNVHTLAPLDLGTFTEAARRAVLVVTVEEHWTAGGLGGAVAEALGRHAPRPLITVGVPGTFVDVAGSHAHLLDRLGITGPAIADRIRHALTSHTDSAHPFQRRNDAAVMSRM